MNSTQTAATTKNLTLAQIGENIVLGHTRIVDNRPAALLELHQETTMRRLDDHMEEALEGLYQAVETGRAVERAFRAYAEAIYRGVAAKSLELVGPSQLTRWSLQVLDIGGKLRRRPPAPGAWEALVEYSERYLDNKVEEQYRGYFPWVESKE